LDIIEPHRTRKTEPMSSAMAPFAFHAIIWSLVLIVAIGTYMYAMSTRRRATCRSCGERVQMEHDTVRNCPSCGAPLK